MNNTLASRCGYKTGWCLRGPRSSCWQLPDKCRYFTMNHPDFPTVTMNKDGDLMVMSTMRYDVIFYNMQEFEAAKPGITKVDTTGYCETCKMLTSFWDLNVKAYVCSDKCRNRMYKKMEEASLGR